MRLNLMLEIDIENFQDLDNILEYPEDVRDTLLSHFDSIEHLIGESKCEWFFGQIIDPCGFRIELTEKDFEK